MKLRTQLVLVGAVVLILPVAGWQFIRQSEPLLRQGQTQSLTDTASTLAALVARSDGVDWPAAGEALYVQAAARPFILDGYADEWRDWPGRAFETGRADRGLKVTAARAAGDLHLLFQVDDPDPVFAEPGPQGRRPGDHLRLVFHESQGRHELRVGAQGPGPVDAASGAGVSLRGVWQPRPGGWNLEVRVRARRALSSLRLELVDAGANPPATLRTVAGSGAEPLVLIGPSAALSARLAGLIPPDTRGWVLDRRGLVLAAAGATGTPDSGETAITWLDRLIYERLLSDAVTDASGPRLEGGYLNGPEIAAALGGRTAGHWRGLPDQPGVVVSAAAPVMHDGRVTGALVVERLADETLRATNRALMALLGLGFGAAALVTLVLLVYAAVLAERIRRLRNAAEGAVAADGRVQAVPATPRAGDEIGDLGRSVGRLLERLRAHQDYLRTLADKLTHELRTPLAAVRTSLENLAHSEDPQARERYLERAEDAAGRLGRILRAMGQAARLEESLVTDTPEPVDLARLLEQYTGARRGLHPDRRIRLHIRARPPLLSGSPDLIWQMLDKLMDNAVAFTPADGRIELRLDRDDAHAVLEIHNQGPPLPEVMDSDLFESMVSLRPRADGETHLGLGLYVARLIVEHHTGDIRARNVSGGVVFRVVLRGVAPDDGRAA